MNATIKTQRWTKICSDCFYVANIGLDGNDYTPESNTYDECVTCGQVGLVINAHPQIARKAAAIRKHGDCSCCGMEFYRTEDGGCTYCAGAKQICCRN